MDEDDENEVESVGDEVRTSRYNEGDVVRIIVG